MKQCLNCQKEFEYKRNAAKFCSDKCRAAYNRAHPSQGVTKPQMQSLYTAVLEAVEKIQFYVPKEYDGPKLANIQDEPLSFGKLKENLGSGNTFYDLQQKLYKAEYVEDLQKLYTEIEKSSISFLEKQKLHNIGKHIYNEKFNF